MFKKLTIACIALISLNAQSQNYYARTWSAASSVDVDNDGTADFTFNGTTITPSHSNALVAQIDGKWKSIHMNDWIQESFGTFSNVISSIPSNPAEVDEDFPLSAGGEAHIHHANGFAFKVNQKYGFGMFVNGALKYTAIATASNRSIKVNPTLEVGSVVSIHEAIIPQFTYFQNETSITIEVEQNLISELQVLDLQGKQLKVVSNSNTIDLAFLTNAIYILHIKWSNGTSYIKKFYH